MLLQCRALFFFFNGWTIGIQGIPGSKDLSQYLPTNMRNFAAAVAICVAVHCIVVANASLHLVSPILYSGKSLRTSATVQKCGLYLVPSTIPGAGRGVVAGTEFQVGENIELIPTLAVSLQTMEACQLKNYGFGSGHENFALIIFGPGNIYNHRDLHTLQRYWGSDDDFGNPLELPYAYSDFTKILYRVRSNIKVGEEMFESYGGDWFVRFKDGPSSDVTEARQEAKVMSMETMEQYGHCLTNVEVKDSTIAGAGSGLFAVKSFEAGEVVTISPVLSLPRRVVDESVSSSVLMNYCFAADDSDHILFPLNYGPLINHNTSGQANVKIVWYDWSPAVEALMSRYPSDTSYAQTHRNLGLQDKLKMTPKELFNAPFAQLDVAYVALRPIAPGEELLLDYGAAWQAAWTEFTARKAEWNAIHAQKSGDAAEPTFRHYITVPDGLYPEHWKRAEATSCDMFMLPSTIPGAGRGIVAGRDFHAHESVEIAPVITITKFASTHSQLANYVFGSGHEDFTVIIFGPGNIYNHRKPHTLGRYAVAGEAERDPTFESQPYSSFSGVHYSTLANIETGEEMYETYGPDWFKRFAAKSAGPEGEDVVTESAREAALMKTSDLLQYGHCITNTEVRESTIPGAGNGLFAKRDFAVGEIVAISPVLSLPKGVVDTTVDTTVLMNYCFADPLSELVLFPLNYGPLINHNTSGEANVKIEWYDWSPAVEALAAKYHADVDGRVKNQNLRLSDKLSMTAEELYSAPFAQLDIAYRATRPIAVGEEIFMDYGPAWHAAWRDYTIQLQEWTSHGEVDGLEKPTFRHYQSLPDGMYSSAWFETAGAEHGEL